MPKQSKPQRDTIGRVMHEFKHGELESGSGRKVKNARQAKAIALSEAGASNQRSEAENKKNLRKTKSKERQGKIAQAEKEGRHKHDGSLTRRELYEEAKEKNLAGRSKMSTDELREALGR